MECEVKLLPNHTLEYWRVDGTDLLYPLHEKGDEMRGGAPMCAPMFSVQQRPVTGCRLPIHGILMYRNDAEVTFDEPANTWTAITHHKADENFAWDFTATTTITIPINWNSETSKLIHQFTIKRNADCINPHEMPLSLGFHSYFNTFGEDFRIIINDNEQTKANIPPSIIDSEFAHLREGEAAVLRTATGELTITPIGYDEYCLWTDNIDQYFCIEPIYQYREFGLPKTGLAAGEQHTATVNLTFSSL